MSMVGCSESYYRVLAVDEGWSQDTIRRAYRWLAMKWHPDKWVASPSQLGEAKRKFQKVQEAYSVLSDKSKRTLYDSGLYDLPDDDDERKEYSMEELRGMLAEMANGFEIPDFSLAPGENWSTSDFPSWNCDSSMFTHRKSPKRARWDTSAMELKNLRLQTSGFSVYGSTSQFCSYLYTNVFVLQLVYNLVVC